MVTTEKDIDALLEMDRFIRLMAVAAGTTEVVSAVRAYVASWSKERVKRLQAIGAGWVPFDAHQRPFPIFNIREVRRIRGSVRIRCRELEAAGVKIGPELLEFDLFFFFANESIEVHETMPGKLVHADRSFDVGAPIGGIDRNTAVTPAMMS